MLTIMKNINLKNKKVGIWGFGIVGKSAFAYLQKHTNQIQIMDKIKPEKLPEHTTFIQETPENIIKFLENNDAIIPSPGIMLHNYMHCAQKFLHELDIFAKENKNSTVAITGTVGKTTITSLLAQCTLNSIAAGNIGNAMLSTLLENKSTSTIILELSSYQLHFTKNFAPDIAIWTNFYPNHLDHHQNEQEYFLAKCNIFKYQTSQQIALLPTTLIERIQNQIKTQAQIYLFETENFKPELSTYPTFFVQQNQLLLHHNGITTVIFDNFNQLPDITFAQNWIIIIAGLYLQKIDLNSIAPIIQKLKPQPHRLEFVTKLNHAAVYNDSKSTVWQATQSAIDKFKGKKIALFLGGISKGTDRAPLIQYVQNKSITVFAFGKEAKILSDLCTTFQIPYYQSNTLQEAVKQYKTLESNFEILLFSPAGASFDLFKNYQDRGEQFKKMILDLANFTNK